MKYWLTALSLCALAALRWLMPVQGTDVAQLQPVELVAFSVENGTILMETDTGDQGTGPSLKAAAANLTETAQGHIFLETVNYVLLEESAQALLPEIVQSHIRPSTLVLRCEGDVDLEQAAEFLAVHTPQTTLWDWKLNPDPLEVLGEEEGRLYLETR